MKKLLLLLVFMPAVVFGQEIIAEEVGDAAILMQSMSEGDLNRKVSAYRVEIFSDNTSAARARAYEAYAKFRELCPEVATDERRDIRYNSPKYTVRVGMFLTYEEALALCGRLRNSFNAYIRTEQLPLSQFAGRMPIAPLQRSPEEPEDSLEIEN